MPTLKERLAEIRQQHKKAAPNLNPSAKKRTTGDAPAPTGWRKKVEPVVPDASEFITDDRDLGILRDLVALHVQYGSEERHAKHEKKPVTESIKSICNDYGVTRVTVDRNKLSYYKLPRESISAQSQQLLRDHGVSQAIIDACNIHTEAYAVRVTPPGVDDDEDDAQGA